MHGTAFIVVRIEGDDLSIMKNRHVVVVEDIIDTGKTMQALLPVIEAQGAKSVAVGESKWG